MRRWSVLVSIFLAGFLARVMPTAIAEKPVVCVGNLGQEMTTSYCPPGPGLTGRFSAGAAPSTLDRHTKEPVRLNVAGRYEWREGVVPPALRMIAFEFDRNGGMGGVGIPVCERRQLAGRGSSGARRACGSSIVGHGTIGIVTPPSGSGRRPLPVTLFYGGVEGSATTVFVHAVVRAPVVVAMKLDEIRAGRYGLEAVLELSVRALADTAITDFQLTTERLAGLAGSRRPFALARCRDSRLQARVTSTFADGTALVGTTVRACAPREEVRGDDLG